MWSFPPDPVVGPSLLWPPNGPQQTSMAKPFTASQPSPAASSPASSTQTQTNPRLFKAIESQVAFIDGDPARHEDLELFYYRFVS